MCLNGDSPRKGESDTFEDVLTQTCYGNTLAEWSTSLTIVIGGLAPAMTARDTVAILRWFTAEGLELAFSTQTLYTIPQSEGAAAGGA